MTARLLIAGVSSNVGKTTVTVALTRALSQRGLKVATFKCGPDYLDPTYHQLASGRASHNLDGWMMGREAVIESFLEATHDADIALIEGAMGLFDGASPSSNEGSSAEIARWLDAPVLLVIDASGMARSVAALVHGYASFDPQLRVAGVFANRVGSAGHLALLREACPLVIGGMQKASSEQFPSRHLGLHAASSDTNLDTWAKRLELDLDAIVKLAQTSASRSSRNARPSQSRRARIGIAQDAAFSFYYPYNLRLLREQGAELVPFSPIADQLPDVDGLYIGGGYPELHAQALTNNHALRAQVHAFAQTGRPIYAECGGLMWLSEAIVTLDGTRHPMLGLIEGQAVMQPKLGALGYVEIETTDVSMLGPAGQRFRGHQFRYSRFETTREPGRYRLHTRRTSALSNEGYGAGNVLASYVHAHWASNPAIAASFVAACAR